MIQTDLGWERCWSCGVTQPPASLVNNPKISATHIKVGWHCKDVARCAEWKATLAHARPSDIAAAAKATAPGLFAAVEKIEAITGPRLIGGSK